MFLSVDVLGQSFLTNYFKIPLRSYNKVNLFGNNVFDGVHLRNDALTDEEVLNISTEEVFDSHTLFLANFENTLGAGNYISLDDPISKWKLKRKIVNGSFTPVILGTFDKDVLNFTDKLQANRRKYEYQLIPVTQSGIEGSPITAIIESDFYGWFLCSVDNSISYKFDMNLESSDITLNKDMTIFENFSTYPIVRIGKRNYHTGSISTIPYLFNGEELTMNNGLLEEVEGFISDGKDKILKNTSGAIYKVQTHDFSYKYMDTFYEQPFTINFSWTQVGDGE